MYTVCKYIYIYIYISFSRSWDVVLLSAWQEEAGAAECSAATHRVRFDQNSKVRRTDNIRTAFFLLSPLTNHDQGEWIYPPFVATRWIQSGLEHYPRSPRMRRLLPYLIGRDVCAVHMFVLQTEILSRIPIFHLKFLILHNLPAIYRSRVPRAQALLEPKNGRGYPAAESASIHPAAVVHKRCSLRLTVLV